jgi:hypothetical protein
VTTLASDTITYSKLSAVIAATKAGDSISLSGNTTLTLASGNSDLATVTSNAVAQQLHNAGISSVKAPSGILNVSFSQQDTLKANGIGFTATDTVTLQLSAGNADLAQVASSAASGSLATNIDAVRASGSLLSVSQAQADKIISAAGLRFVDADTVTLRLDAGNTNATSLAADSAELTRLKAGA